MTTTDQQTHAAPDTDAADVEAVACFLYCEAGLYNTPVSWAEHRKDADFRGYWASKAKRTIAAYQARLADTGRGVVEHSTLCGVCNQRAKAAQS